MTNRIAHEVPVASQQKRLLAIERTVYREINLAAVQFIQCLARRAVAVRQSENRLTVRIYCAAQLRAELDLLKREFRRLAAGN